jgi:outer membrane lipoprotein-sorting protein
MRAALLFLLVAAPMVAAEAGPTTQPGAPDPALWSKLTQIDARAAKIQSLSADFVQQKFTTLLTRPLVSSGTVKIRGTLIRWDTVKPEQSTLLLEPHEARIYYPAQKALEVYPLDQRMAELAASPLPRLDVLKKTFSFRELAAGELEKNADPSKYLALSLIPTDGALRQHVQEVRVLLNVPGGYLVKGELTDGDGDRTFLAFSKVHLNADVGDLSLTVPPGTRVSRPLEGLDNAVGSQGSSK